ncbi:MAG TPA: hypothetical protein VME40_09645 [Caulobacteraceae bacterium]|nr:hypothetical protein [Caulobacteraceae bacterium]
MGQIDIGDAATAGLRMIGRQPIAVLCWGLLMAVYVGVLFVLFSGGIASAISALVANGASTPPPTLIVQLLANAFGFIALLLVGVQLLDIVFRAAAIRAELEPQASSFAYMRVGGQEAWVLAASFVFFLVLFGANLLMAIPLSIVTLAAGIGQMAASGGAPASHAAAGLNVVSLFGQLLVNGVLIWLWLRLSLGVVMSYHERQFRLFESWTLTRGHAWRMFLALLLVTLMLIALGLVMGIVCMITVAISVGAVASNPQAFFAQPPSAWMAAATPLMVVILIWIVVGVGLGNALMWGAVARMWRQLSPETDTAKTFA